MFNMLRDNQGTFVVNKNTEDFKNVSASLAGLHELQAQAQEHMASVSRIPLVKFTGIQPAGLNASSEGEIEVYDDTIAAYQKPVLRAEPDAGHQLRAALAVGRDRPGDHLALPAAAQMTEAEKGQSARTTPTPGRSTSTWARSRRRFARSREELPFTDLNRRRPERA
jgi:hypothetical protein